MPPGLSVYEPRITREGDTTIFTYNVKVEDFTSIKYTAQTAAATVDAATAQSIEALIWHYGVATGGTLFGSTVVSKVDADQEFSLTEKTPNFVIIPLQVSRIKEFLTNRVLPPLEAESVSLVWIEENPAIGTIDPVKNENNWENGTYEDSGIRIIGLAKPGDDDVVIAGTIENFDDGEKIDPEKTVTRIASIATVLADGSNPNGRYTSAINFYTASNATAILTGVATGGDLETAVAAKAWLKTNKPALRIVYQWAE
jgi:hypothetical protein